MANYIPESEALRQAGIWAGEGKYKPIEPGYTPSVIDRVLFPDKVQLYKELVGNQEAFSKDFAKFNKPFFEGLNTTEPTLGQFSGSQGGLPAGFLESQQLRPMQAEQPIGQSAIGEPISPSPLELQTLQKRAGEFSPLVEKPLFDPQARLSPSQMTVAAPLLEQRAVLGRGDQEGQIIPTTLAGVENRKVLPQEITSALDVASGRQATVPLPPTIASKAIEERTKYTQPMTYKDIPDKAVAIHLMGQGLAPTPENIKQADAYVKKEQETQTFKVEREKNRLRAGTEGLDDASVALWGVPNSDVTGQVKGIDPLITPNDVPRVNAALQNTWKVIGLSSKPPVVSPGISKAQLNLAVRDRIKLETMAAQGAAGEMAKPIEVSQQERISILENNLRIMQGLTNSWQKLTPEQQQKYVGIVNFPLSKLKQFIDQQIKGGSDPAFAQFATQIYLAKQLAFQSGGKQLTPFEASVVFGYTPTGEEMSVNDFVAKMTEAGVNTEDLLRRTAEIATVPRREIKGQVQKSIEQYRVPRKVTEAEYKNLPSGAMYIAPNGQTMKKP